MKIKPYLNREHFFKVINVAFYELKVEHNKHIETETNTYVHYKIYLKNCEKTSFRGHKKGVYSAIHVHFR